MVEQSVRAQAGAPPDLNAVQAQTQPAALKLLEDAGLGALLRDLRAMKAAAGELAVQKALAQAIRRAVTERRARQGSVAGGTDAVSARLAAKATAASGKAEEKARKEAERAERKRVKEAERAEKKAAKAARKLVSVTRAEAKDKARAKKLAKLGGGKGAGRQGQGEAVKPAEAISGAKPKPGKGKPGKHAGGKNAAGKTAAGKLRPDGTPKPARKPAGAGTPAGDDEASF